MKTPDQEQRGATVREQLINQARLKLYDLAKQNIVPPETVDEFNTIRFDRMYAPVKTDDILAAIISEKPTLIIFLVHERVEGPPSRIIPLGERHGRIQKPVVR